MSKPTLAELEKIIAANQGDPLKKAKALLEIQRQRLYRTACKPPFKTIRDYAQTVWKISRRQFHRITEWAQVLELAKKCPKGHKAIQSANLDTLLNERSAREYFPLIKHEAFFFNALQAAITTPDAIAEDGHLKTSAALKSAHVERDKIREIKMGEILSRPTDPRFRDWFICADVSKGLPMIPDGSLDLIFCSPPYGIKAIIYDVWDDNITHAAYMKHLRRWMEVAATKLKHGGRIGVNLPNTWSDDKRKEYIHPLPLRLITIMESIPQMMLYQDIIWDRECISEAQNRNFGTFESAECPNMRRVSERVMIFAKGTFKRKVDKDNRLITEADFGALSSDIWKIKPDNQTRAKYPHPCIMPVPLVERFCMLFGQRRDRIVDIFGGSGTTAIAAHSLGMDFRSIDISHKYTKMAHERFVEYLNKSTKGSKRHNSK